MEDGRQIKVGKRGRVRTERRGELTAGQDSRGFRGEEEWKRIDEEEDQELMEVERKRCCAIQS